MKKLFIGITIILFAASCQVRQQTPDIKNIKTNFILKRFDKDLFNVDINNIKSSTDKLKKEYGEFFDLFCWKIIRIGNPDATGSYDLLITFLTDYDINKTKSYVDSIFKDFSPFQQKLETMFRYYKYYFPEERIPQVVTYISGFNQSVVTTDTLLGISLDKYLGSECVFYKMLGLPQYMRKKMVPQMIPFDCARGWAITQFPMNDSINNNLLSYIIYQGKIIYFMKQVLPDEPDSLIFGMSEKNIEWCKKYEKEMWVYLINQKYLYSSDYFMIREFIEDAPYTKKFGNKSPGKAVTWIGYRIIKDYINNTNITLQELMKEEDYNKILKLAKYKP